MTCRRDPDAASGDQALVLIRRGDGTLEQTTSWGTLGMRGTCSPGFKLCSSGPQEQILPVPFAEISAQTMVPYSHTLWSGIAADAVARAGAYVRGEARKRPGTTPPAAMRLAEVTVQLQTMRHNWQSVAQAYDEIAGSPEGAQVVGILGYKNDTPFSLGRHYRDALSASLMVSNERIAAQNASMLLVFKDPP